MKPSPYQQAVLDWFTNSSGNAIVDAVAGSGKTTTGVMISEIISPWMRAVYLAFSKDIADTLAKKLPPHVLAKTFHSFGFMPTKRYIEAEFRVRVKGADTRKTDRILDRILSRDLMGIRAAIVKLTSLAMQHIYTVDTDDDSYLDLIRHFDIDWEDDSQSEGDVIYWSKSLLKARMADPSFDFDDMLYLPIVKNLRLDTYDVVFVDEAQDTNPLRREIARRILAPNGRLIAVGDPFQAIYGFTGASHDSMDVLRDTFQACTLPLSISYRCSRAVVAEAKRFVPHIEAGPNAIDGSVTHPSVFKFSAFVAGDYVVCRNTAPIIQLAYRFLARQIPATVLGREIGAGLKSLVNKLCGVRNRTIPQLLTRLDDYETEEIRRAMTAHRESKAGAIADRCAAIRCLIDSLTHDATVDELLATIDRLFADKANAIKLSTIHKSKGLEAPRVFILDPALLPSKYARQEWQQIQERNLHYVAITRAERDLVYVDSQAIID